MMNTSFDQDNKPSTVLPLPYWATDSNSDQEDDFADAETQQTFSFPADSTNINSNGNINAGDAQEASNAGPSRNSKTRRPPNTAERRATHNAVERARRESLNGRFMELAAALPSMSSVKRPSKSMIVNKSIEYVFGAEEREKQLREINAALRREVDELRMQLGLSPKNNLSSGVQPLSPATNISIAKRVSVCSNNSFTDDSFSAGTLSCSPASTVNSFFTSSPKESGTPPATSQQQQQQGQISPVNQNSGMNLTPVDLPPPQVNVAAYRAPNVQQQTGNNAAATTFPFSAQANPTPQVPYLDVNYFMRLGMQQQQQQQQQQQEQQQHRQQQQQRVNQGLALVPGLHGWNPYHNMQMSGSSHPTSLVPDLAGAYAFA